MRLLQIPYLLGRTCRDERLDDLVHPWIATARRQLPVGERSRTTLAELDIRRGVKLPRPPELRHITRTPIHILPTFEDERCRPRTREKPRGKDPRRAEPHDDGALTILLRRIGRDTERTMLLCTPDLCVTAQTREDAACAVCRHIERIVPPNRCPISAPCIQRLMNDNHPVHCTG